MKKTLSYFFRYWPVALMAVIALTGESICDLQQPTLLKHMIDEGVVPLNGDVVRDYAMKMLGVAALGMLCAISRAVLASHVSQRFGRDVRLALYTNIQRISLTSVDNFDRASLITRLTNDVTQVQNFLNGMMRFFLRAPILCIGGIVYAYQLSHRLGIVLAIVVPVAAAIIITSIKLGYPYFLRVQNSLDRLNANVREYLSGVRVVKAFNRFGYEKQRFESGNDDLTRASSSAMRLTSVFGPAIALVVNLGICLVLWLGGNIGEESGTVLAFINYMTQIMMALGAFSNIFNQLVRALVSGQRMDEVLSADVGMDMSGTKVPDDVNDGIRFENVSFRYANAQSDVLSGISFAAKPGETIGIIGATGAGKSTLVNLLPRFYDVTGGAIYLGGADIREFDIAALRDRVAIVPQQNLLFTGTIASNLRWGKADATEAEMWAALEAAQAASFIRKFPECLETQLGQAGVNLSGGQKQRISIARALIKRPDVLILDDCTSAVDATTEAAIRRELREYSSSILCLKISQRIGSIMSADRILVLEHGEVAGFGSHKQLMDTCPVYQDIYLSQIGKEAAQYV